MLKAFDRAIGTTVGACVGMGFSAVGRQLRSLGSSWLEPCFALVGITMIFTLSSCTWTRRARRHKWFKDHSYIMLMGLVTMGIAWFPEFSSSDMWHQATSRINAIFAGNLLALLVLVIFPRGSALGKCHGSLAMCARTAAELVQDLCRASAQGEALPSLSEMVLGGEAEDAIHHKYLAILSVTQQIRVLLPFASWEPRYLVSKRPWWAEPKAGSRYRLLSASITRLATTSIAIDTQLRSMRPAKMNDQATAATTAFAKNVHDLLQAIATLLDESLTKSGCTAPTCDTRIRVRQISLYIRESIEELEAVFAGDGSDASEFSGREAPSVRDACGQQIEQLYVARAGLALPFLLTELGVQAVRFCQGVDQLLYPPKTDPASQVEAAAD